MALVICCVLRTERIRRRISIRLGIESFLTRDGGERLPVAKQFQIVTQYRSTASVMESEANGAQI